MKTALDPSQLRLNVRSKVDDPSTFAQACRGADWAALRLSASPKTRERMKLTTRQLSTHLTRANESLGQGRI